MGFGARVAYAFRCFFSLLFKGTIAREIIDAVVPGAAADSAAAPSIAPAPVAPRRDDPGDRAVQLLAILQRDGRLVDFLQEDLSTYTDAQVGAAVRDVHASCRQAIERYMSVEPVLADEEGSLTTVGATADPATVRLVGNVGKGDGRGTVRHRGWRIGRLELPPLPDESARLVIAPAEVEVD